VIAFEIGQPLPLHGFGLHLQHTDLRILLLEKLLQKTVDQFGVGLASTRVMRLE
jgi:hypothetical protein